MTTAATNHQTPCPEKFLRYEAVVASHAEMGLRRSSYRELRGISCYFHEGVLTLRGRLPSYYLKQVAQTLVVRTVAHCAVVNRIEVVDRSRTENSRSIADGTRPR